MKRLLKYKDFVEEINESLRLQALVDELPLFEGGAYGHLAHPFEDMDLTMQDFRDMINTTINGSFSPNHFLQEKTDGVNIMVSWKNGKLKF